MKNIVGIRKCLGAIHKSRIDAKWATDFRNDDALIKAVNEMKEELSKLSMIISLEKY